VGIHQPPFTLVFSSVDDVLDTAQPAFRSAGFALAQLAPAEAAVVMCSGKTRAELAFIQQGLGLHHPFICEHGSAVLIPAGYFPFDVPNARPVAGFDALEFGRPYDEIVDALHRVARRHGIDIVAFSDMSIDQVARECAIPLLEARLAKLREYSERFRVLERHQAYTPRLLKTLHLLRLHCTNVGRFTTVNASVDHSLGINLLSQLYRMAFGPILRLGVSPAAQGVLFFPFVDHALTVPASLAAPAALASVVWADTVVDGVRTLQQQTAGRASHLLS
jgi:predicted mannosyl-3-phosphoglycerate phosphatase (HAD superfamily)